MSAGLQLFLSFLIFFIAGSRSEGGPSTPCLLDMRKDLQVNSIELRSPQKLCQLHWDSSLAQGFLTIKVQLSAPGSFEVALAGKADNSTFVKRFVFTSSRSTMNSITIPVKGVSFNYLTYQNGEGMAIQGSIELSFSTNKSKMGLSLGEDVEFQSLDGAQNGIIFVVVVVGFTIMTLLMGIAILIAMEKKEHEQWKADRSYLWEIRRQMMKQTILAVKKQFRSPKDSDHRKLHTLL
eukprot:TRINITY_DN12421_c0_g1_i1.p1 TRINITY_DN12421_c0_g1~~TRINITY_DN12421_c0_g1_i1.p1  ORF type:complete len:236 (-),score=20.74 TRINITY_DN12421_c0_g1_i1:108-815(-)